MSKSCVCCSIAKGKCQLSGNIFDQNQAAFQDTVKKSTTVFMSLVSGNTTGTNIEMKRNINNFNHNQTGFISVGFLVVKCKEKGDTFSQPIRLEIG
ncbi:CLUMA_CG003338, isoform A [Clunio marinus]|uniref:CLUMA_CG003338, isoform A n=1 Tax=Clunio marinus TaxID=568069 RepID=A0A1J1HSS6_9DIPT|nr:CLUMA_CG003338, isoform A [Clunio marinus]